MAFADDFKKDKEEVSKGKSEWYKFPDGETRCRIIQEPVKMFEKYDNFKKKFIVCWHDCGFQGSIKYLARVWLYQKNKETGEDESKLVIMKLPFTVMDKIVELMTNEEYKFETFPMPFDITVKKTGEKLDTEYTVIPARANSDVPAGALAAVEGQKPLAEVVEAMKDKSKKEFGGDMNVGAKKELGTIEYPTDDINPEDIPF